MSLRRAGLGLLTAAALLAGLEGVLRLAGDPPTDRLPGFSLRGVYPAHSAPDPDLGWRQVPGEAVDDHILHDWHNRWGLPRSSDLGTISPLGLRDTPLADPLPPGQKRAVVIGDSSVWGSGCPWSLTFTQRTEAALNLPGSTPQDRAVEVINAGVSGYSSYQALAHLDRLVDEGLRPDVVVAYLMNSDAMPAEGGTPDAVWFDRPRSLWGLSLTRWMAAALQTVRPPTQPEAVDVRVPVDAFADNLRRLSQTAEELEAALILIVPPLPEDVMRPRASPGGYQDAAATGPEGWPFFGYRQAIIAEGARAGAGVLDAPEIFAEAARTGTFRRHEGLFVDGIHPSATGHALIAEALTPLLQARLSP